MALAAAAGGYALVSAGAVAKSEDAKIGYVDTAKVFDQYEKTKRSDKILEAKVAAKQTERQGQVEEIRKLKDETELLSDEQRRARQDVIGKKLEDLRGFDERAQEELQRERDALGREILEELERAIQEFGAKEGYTLILPRRALLYGEAGLDVTDEIIRRLNHADRGER